MALHCTRGVTRPVIERRTVRHPAVTAAAAATAAGGAGPSSPERSSHSDIAPSATEAAAAAAAAVQADGGLYDFERRHHAVSLAYLGDAVWELYVRRAAYVPPKHHSRYLAAVRPHVSAEGQAAYHDWLMASGALAPHEAALLQWAGRKQHVRMRTRFSRAGAERTYRRATALEALVGYLHMTDPQRLQLLAAQMLESGAVAAPGDGNGSAAPPGSATTEG